MAPHLILDRTKKESLVEKDDNVFINDKSLAKPFVVKPVNAEDHDVRRGGAGRVFKLCYHSHARSAYPAYPAYPGPALCTDLRLLFLARWRRRAAPLPQAQGEGMRTRTSATRNARHREAQRPLACARTRRANSFPARSCCRPRAAMSLKSLCTREERTSRSAVNGA